MSQPIFTPRTKDGKRLSLVLSPDDLRKIGRGRPWRAEIVDLNTSAKYRVKGASCGIPRCFCDAVVVEGPTP